MTNLFLDYLKRNYYENFVNAIEAFCLSNIDVIEEKFGDRNIESIEIGELDFKSSTIGDEGGDGISFDVVINPEVIGTLSLGHGDIETESTNGLWVICSCSADIKTSLENFSINYVEERTSKTINRKPLSGDLVPIIRKTDSEASANEILHRYYPEAIKKGTKVDSELLAKRMGLRIIERRISENHAIFGQFFFDNGKARFYSEDSNAYYDEDVPGNTIVVDPDAAYQFSRGEKNLTIAHECVHAYYHKKAFRFAKLFNTSLSSIICSNNGEKAANNETLKWMERQANSLAPHLLVPNEQLKAKADEIRKEIAASEYFDPLVDTSGLIDEIANYFSIPKQTARRRLIEIGYENATGCLEWVDGKYIRSYLFEKGSLGINETFTISAHDLHKALSTPANGQTLAFVLSGALIFVENHLVINSPKYIETEKGETYLTNHARRHLDECAIKFKIRILSQDVFDDFVGRCYLCKQASPSFKYSIVVSDNKGLADSPSAREAVNSITRERTEIKGKISDLDLSGMLKAIKDYRGITIKELEDDSCLDERTIRRYLNGENKDPDKRTLIALCIGLRVYDERIIDILFKEAGLAWKDNDPEDVALTEILFFERPASVKQANAALKNMGFKSLTKEKQ